MPVVPFTQARIKPRGLPDVPPPSEPFALMAAAQMNQEGRLLKPDPPLDIRSDAQKQKVYQPDDPANMRREQLKGPLLENGTWMGTPHVEGQPEGLY